MALYVSTPISNEAVNHIQKALMFEGDSPLSSPIISVTGRDGTRVYATALVQDGEYIAADEWEVYLKQATVEEQQSLSMAAFQGDLEVRIGGILLASFNDDDSQLSLAGGSSSCSSSSPTSEVGICVSESGMILRIIGDGPRKILTTPTKKHQVKFKIDNNLEEKKEECN
jgi:hypothetical protein